MRTEVQLRVEYRKLRGDLTGAKDEKVEWENCGERCMESLFLARPVSRLVDNIHCRS